MAERMSGIPRFSHSRLVKRLEQLRALGASEMTVEQFPKALASFGIRFLIVEHLPRTKVDGATFWLDRSRPVVVLSLRYSRLDYFVFTLFHELMHIKHRDAWSIDADFLTSSVSANTSAVEKLREC